MRTNPVRMPSMKDISSLPGMVTPWHPRKCLQSTCGWRRRNCSGKLGLRTKPTISVSANLSTAPRFGNARPAGTESSRKRSSSPWRNDEDHAPRRGLPWRSLDGDPRGNAGPENSHRPRGAGGPAPLRSPAARTGGRPKERPLAGSPRCREGGGPPHREPLPLRSPRTRLALDLQGEAGVLEGRQVPHQPEPAGAGERVREGPEEVPGR